jgi:FdhE protein
VTAQLSAKDAAERIRNAIEKMREEIPQLSNLLDALGELIAEQEALKAELPPVENLPKEIDEVLFSQGVHVLVNNAFSIPLNSLKKSAGRLIPVMMRGFPKISEQLSAIATGIETSGPNSFGNVHVDFTPTDERISELAASLNVDPEIMRFTLTHFMKPYAAKNAEAFAELIRESKWLKGYCPICGSWPELGFLEGPEGRRWLRCSFCSHEWTFSRTECPFCESGDPDELEIFYSEDRSFERAELCHGCKKYLVSVDLRERQGIVRDVAALGMVYLDILAQEKGFSPGAASYWNIFEDEVG